MLGRKLHQIRAVVTFGKVKAGEVGGWIEKEDNLDQSGNAWVCGDAQVCEMSHYLTVGPIGSRNGFTTFFRTKDLEINVTCGCFHGNIEAFTKRVQKTHGDNDHAKRYGIAIELAKACINLSPEE